MTDIKINDLPPEPFFTRFLEDQEPATMTRAEMRAVKGGEFKFPTKPGLLELELPDLSDVLDMDLQGCLFKHIPNEIPGAPRSREPEMVTLAYPSDSDHVGI